MVSEYEDLLIVLLNMSWNRIEYAKLQGMLRTVFKIRIFIYRSMRYDESLQRAKALMFERRGQRAFLSDKILVPAERGAWGDDCPLNAERLVRAVSGRVDTHDNKPDRASMQAFLDGVNPNKINVPSSLTHLNLFPAGAPVLDFYRAYAQKFDA